MKVLTFLISFIALTSVAVGKSEYKAPKFPTKWQKTAEKIIKSQNRAPASIEDDSTPPLLTLDEIVGKNKKKAAPKARPWRVDYIR